MKTLLTFLSLLLALNISAQSDSISAPEWYKNIPENKGLVYGVGMAESRDKNMAESKARTLALGELTKAFNNRFETFAARCDTVLGPNSEARNIITRIRSSSQATIIGATEENRAISNHNNMFVVYLLLKINIEIDKKSIQSEFEANKELWKQMRKLNLIKELADL